MAKQTINIGSLANDGTGSNLRDGATIINDNFNEIYSTIGNGTYLNTPIDLGSIGESIIPDTDVTYDLGSTTKRFKDLYLSGTTIDLGGVSISNIGGVVSLPGVNTIGYRPSSVYGPDGPESPLTSFPLSETYPDIPKIIDQVTYNIAIALEENRPSNYTRATYTPAMSLLSSGTINAITISDKGSLYPTGLNYESVNGDNMWALPSSTDLNDLDSIKSAILEITSNPPGVYGVISAGVTSETLSVIIPDPDATPTPTDLSDLTDSTNLLFDRTYASLSGTPTTAIVVNPPSSSFGQSGDTINMIAFDSSFFYYCRANYTVGVQIWERIAPDATPW